MEFVVPLSQLVYYTKHPRILRIWVAYTTGQTWGLVSVAPVIVIIGVLFMGEIGWFVMVSGDLLVELILSPFSCVIR